LIERGIPVVFFDRACEDVEASKVVIDDFKSAYLAVSYLIEKGYKRIAHFAGPIGLEICKKRLIGYKEALKDAKYHYEEVSFSTAVCRKRTAIIRWEICLEKN